MIAGHAQNARTLGEWLGLPPAALAALAASYERWDGRGWPEKLWGSDPGSGAAGRARRVRGGGPPHRELEGAVAARRAQGSQFDPGLVAVLCADAGKVFHGIDDLSSWEAVVDGEPTLAVPLTAEQLDAALGAVGAFADLKSPHRLGHSAALATLVTDAAARLELPPAEVRLVRRAALVSASAVLGVFQRYQGDPGLWRPVSGSGSGCIRSSPRGCCASPGGLAGIGRLAAMHTERLDGYHLRRPRRQRPSDDGSAAGRRRCLPGDDRTKAVPASPGRRDSRRRAAPRGPRRPPRRDSRRSRARQSPATACAAAARARPG